MARPLKQGLDYFPHDTDALNDKKIQRLISEYGLAGYGFYFALLEDIYSSQPAPYKWKENGEILARRCRLSVAKAQRILNFCLETQLFFNQNYNNDSTLTSHSIIERADTILKARTIKRNQRLNASNTNGQMAGQTAGQTGESKVKLNNKLNITNVIIPDWIQKETWDSFIEMRKKQKATPTEKAIELLVKELEKLKEMGNDPNKVLEQSIMNNWKGVFLIKDSQGGNHDGKNRQDSKFIPGNQSAGAFSELAARDAEVSDVPS